MLGRTTYTREEFDRANAAVGAQLAAYKAIVKAASASSDKKVNSSLEAFEPLFFNHLLLALDRYFVHRVRPVTGKDGNPLNEVEMLCDSLITNDGVLKKSTVLKLIPEQSVSKLQFGDTIRLNREKFERLSGAFFTDLEHKFL